MIDREYFFDSVRGSLFGGGLSQGQVDGMTALLTVWETAFISYPKEYLAYALATSFHETAQKMEPIEEYGKGAGHSYGEPAGPYDQCYYGRGHVQLTWEDNYKKADDQLDKYSIDSNLHEHAEEALRDDVSAYVLFDGSIYGWFTGVGLPDYFNADEEDPYNARKIINGLDKAETIEGYYWKFKNALVWEWPVKLESYNDGGGTDI